MKRRGEEDVKNESGTLHYRNRRGKKRIRKLRGSGGERS